MGRGTIPTIITLMGQIKSDKLKSRDQTKNNGDIE